MTNRLHISVKNILYPLIFSSLLITPQLANSAEEANQSHWKNAPNLPYKVQEIYPTVFNNHIIVAGGLSPDVGAKGIGVSDRVVVYDLEKKVWKEGPSLPEPRHHPMLVVVNNRLLSFGGFTVDAQGIWHNSTDVLELTPKKAGSNGDILTTGQWQNIAQMPAPLAETLGAVHNGKVHLVTGRTPKTQSKNSQWIEQADVSTHYTFDLNTLTWANAAPAPTARNSACSVTTDKLYTIGGRTVSGGNLASHEAYDFKTDTWQTLAPLPAAQGGLACATDGKHIYVFGGEFFNNGGGVYSEVWQYSISKDTWQAVSEMPSPRHGLGALTINGSIYVIGGALQAGGVDTSSLMTTFSLE
ncbi:Kelch repeat-containing protein [Thalassotalea euphylliae]|uniref:Kelch repeat-containing protein n=1 Tax=Thalassotalea euphylliae TaxID=1655234 RepID=UPI00362F01DE